MYTHTQTKGDRHCFSNQCLGGFLQLIGLGVVPAQGTATHKLVCGWMFVLCVYVSGWVCVQLWEPMITRKSVYSSLSIMCVSESGTVLCCCVTAMWCNSMDVYQSAVYQSVCHSACSSTNTKTRLRFIRKGIKKLWISNICQKLI